MKSNYIIDIKTPAQDEAKATGSEYPLKNLGFRNLNNVYWNLPVESLYEAAIRNGEAQLATGGTLLATTGEHTGRSPRDKFIVRDELTESTVAWGAVNQEMSPETFGRLHRRMMAYLQSASVGMALQRT